jgi:AcrR family transcriptional regulator
MVSEKGLGSGPVPTRRRVITEAMRLFGEQGYHATSVAQIEAAAGLRSGSGGLYRHFASKRALLEIGIRDQLEGQQELFTFISDPARMDGLPLRERLTIVAEAGLARLDRERDLNRIILRDLRFFPELLALVREQEFSGVRTGLARWLKTQIDAATPPPDWDAVAGAIMGSVSHHWLLRDALGTDPSGVDEKRYIAALVDLLAARLEPAGE